MCSQRILISVRGKNEAMEAVAGGADIIDVEYPGSALGTPYPLNIRTVRRHVPSDRLVATNIGEKQHVWATASQAALGVAVAGADIIKVGLAELSSRMATRVMDRVVRNVRAWSIDKILIATFFADDELRAILNPITESQQVGMTASVNGILIDTFYKDKKRALLDYFTLSQISEFVTRCHNNNLEAWVAGSLMKEQLPSLWRTEVDVICIREAALAPGTGEERMGKVNSDIVKQLVDTIP